VGSNTARPTPAMSAPRTQNTETALTVSKLTRCLLNFGFAGSFSACTDGPVVNTFYFKPEGNSKFASVLNKAEEIAGALAVESVLIDRELGHLAIAVPRTERQTVSFDSCLHSLLTSPATAGMALPLLMGVDPRGIQLYADLASQPHMLIAGATNSGKSVYTAQLISSLALFKTPAELEFILVDTKNLDLVLFKSLPHVKYVISEIFDLRVVLVRLLEDVRLRNQQMSGLTRNIGEWNNGFGGASAPMKYKILIVDELADVFMQDDAILRPLKRSERPPSIEELIQQISQISRAAGVHLVLATQRPSVDVLPGTIKNNFPARVCFKVPSGVDSKVVLDSMGAESLLGAGDYLYKIAGSDTVKRAHSAFISMNNIATIICQSEEIRRQYDTITAGTR
jgi:DNA segregation ATPase FtsK/SpoIIIE, S-DNA-T family